MSTSSTHPAPVSPVTPPPGKRTVRTSTLVISTVLGLGLAGGIGFDIGASAVPEAVTVTKNVPVPGPTVTQTEQVPAPPPPAGTVIETFRGHGTQVTPQFTTPDSGDYVVKWSYSGNVDTSLGQPQPVNFIISETGSGNAMGLPDDIAASGSGSTEVTGATTPDALNVKSSGSWVITIVSAP